MVGRPFSAWTRLSLCLAIAHWKKICMDRRGLPTWGLKARGGGSGEQRPLINVSGRERGVGGPGQANHPHPPTAKCVSWMRIQGNCASPHSVCSEANAFLSYCLRRRLVVGTPIISSLGERPRCLESGCGRTHSKGRKAAW